MAEPEKISCPECEKTQGMAKYWEMEYNRLMEQLVKQKEVVEQSARMNEQAALAIKALSNKIIALKNENLRLTQGLRTVSIINKAAARKPGLILPH